MKPYLTLLCSLFLFCNYSSAQIHAITSADSSYFMYGRAGQYGEAYYTWNGDQLKQVIPNGTYKFYSDSSKQKLAYKGVASGNKKNGTWTYYHPNGKIAQTVQYRAGKQNGITKKYSYSGGLILTQTYKDGKLHGRMTSVLDYGDPFDSYQYAKIGVFNYVDGKLNGLANYWINGGEVNVKESYVAGRKSGTALYYNNFNQKLKEIVYENGKKVKETIVEGKTNATTYTHYISGSTVVEVREQLAKLKLCPNVHTLGISIQEHNPTIDSLIANELKGLASKRYLRKIKLAGQITQIPLDIFNCTGLTHLSFRDLPASEVPAQISKLRNLKVLTLRSMGSGVYGQVDGRMKKIKDPTPLNTEEIIKKVKTLPNLKEFHFYGNYTELPTNIGILTQIEALFLASYGVCTSSSSIKLGELLNPLKNLKAVQLCSGQIKSNRDDLETALPNCKLLYYHTCFGKNTAVTMLSGRVKPIQEIVVGDSIVAYDTEQKKLVKAAVTEIHAFTDELYTLNKISFKGKKKHLKATSNHPILLESGEWTVVSDLKIGDVVFQLSSKNDKLESVAIILSISEMELPVNEVYNIKTTVGNYFANGILVHNK